MPPLEEQLQPLRQLLIEERRCARDLDMQGLQSALRGKTELLSKMKNATVDSLDTKTQQMIHQIRLEIRRNTRLYHSCIHTILGIWSAHCRQSGSQGYDPMGHKTSDTPTRHLLSGKI